MIDEWPIWGRCNAALDGQVRVRKVRGAGLGAGRSKGPGRAQFTVLSAKQQMSCSNFMITDDQVG